jgi:hypothetical protein
MCCTSKGSAHSFHFFSYASGEFSLIKHSSCHLISMLPHSALKQPVKKLRLFAWFRRLRYSWGNIELQTRVDAMVVVGSADRILVILRPMHKTRTACGTESGSLSVGETLPVLGYSSTLMPGLELQPLEMHTVESIAPCLNTNYVKSATA